MLQQIGYLQLPAKNSGQELDLIILTAIKRITAGLHVYVLSIMGSNHMLCFRQEQKQCIDTVGNTHFRFC